MRQYSYWWDTVDPPWNKQGSVAASIDIDRVDVAVVGGGYTGLSAAAQLAEAGASVIVLERESIGWGASSRNAGQVLTGLRLDPFSLVARFGENRARELFAASLEAIASLEHLIDAERISCDFERTGHLQAAWKPAHFAAFRREQELLAKVFNHRVRVVAPDEQRLEIASLRYHGVLVDERSAAINPAKYVRGLCAAGLRKGAEVREHTAVRAIARSSGRWRVTTSAGQLDADDVLIATNGYTDGAAPALQRRLVPIGSYMVATEPLDQAMADALLPLRRTAFDSKHFLYYFRVTTDRRLIFGGRAAFRAATPDATRRASVILRRGLEEVFPQLSGVRLDYAWNGNVAFTRDQMPRAGRLNGLWYAGGYCGHGIAIATYLGTLIARRIAGEPIAHPLFDDHFKAIPLYAGRPWFLPLVGAYYRIRDLVD